MATTLLLPLILVCQIAFGSARAGHEGLVVAAPHGGYDQHSEDLARDVAERLGWGWVVANGYRSVPLRYWYDVNRPSERPWRGYEFGDDRWSSRAQAIYDEYQESLEDAARERGPLALLVEIHGHARRVNTSSGALRVQAIELATSGFSRAELRRLARRYEELQDELPASQRVPLAIDDLDDHYAYRGYWIPFYFNASAAKRDGSLRRSSSARALHFELPPDVRGGYWTRRAYVGLLSRLLESTWNDVR